MKGDGLTLTEWATLFIAVTTVLLVAGLGTWAALAWVKRRLLQPPSNQESLDPLQRLLEQDRDVLTREEARLLRRKLAERMLQRPEEDKGK
ncbi:hypothetical protein HS125_00145 [bacterium]|nr:hypothetical protein [bacterium]